MTDLRAITQHFACTPAAQAAAENLTDYIAHGLPYPISHPLWRLCAGEDGQAQDYTDLGTQHHYVGWLFQAFENWLRLTGLSLAMDYLLTYEQVPLPEAQQQQLNKALYGLRHPSLGSWQQWLTAVARDFVPAAEAVDFSPLLAGFMGDVKAAKPPVDALIALRNQLNLAHGVMGLDPQHVPKTVARALNQLLPLLDNSRWFADHPLYLLQQPAQDLVEVSAWRLDRPTFAEVALTRLDLAFDYRLGVADLAWQFGQFEFVLLDQARELCQPLSPMVVKTLGVEADKLKQLARDHVLLYAGDTGKQVVYTGMGYFEDKLLSKLNIEALGKLFALRRVALDAVGAGQCTVADLVERGQRLTAAFVEVEQERSHFKPEVLVSRTEWLGQMQAFIRSASPALLLAGPSGIGKSWAVAEWAQQVAEDATVIAVPVRALELPAQLPNAKALFKELMSRLRIEGEWKDWRKRLEQLQTEADAAAASWCVVLVVEAVNEYGGDGKQLYGVIQEAVQQLAESGLARVRLVYTLRSEFLRSYCATSGATKQVLPDPRWHFYDFEQPRKNADGQIEAWLSLAEWGAAEVALAYPKYQAQAGTAPLTPLAEVLRDADLMQLLTHPYWLWLVCRAYNGRSLPAGLRLLQVYADLLEEELLLPEKAARWDLVRELVPVMWEAGTAMPTVEQLLAVPRIKAAVLDAEPSGVVSQLVQCHLLSWQRLPSEGVALPQYGLRFAHEGLGEYVLAEWWLRSHDEAAFFALPFWEAVAEKLAELPLAAGAAVTLLLRLSAKNVTRVGAWVVNLAGAFGEDFQEAVLFPLLAVDVRASGDLVRAVLAAEGAETESGGRFFHQLGFYYHYTQWQWVMPLAYRRALQIRQTLSQAEPERVDLAQNLGTSCNNLAVFLEDKGEAGEAERLYQQALEIRERLSLAHPERVDLAQDLGISCNNLALFLKAQGESSEAERLYRQAVEIRERLSHAHPERVDLAQNLGISCNNLAAFLQAQGEAGEAERLYRQALEIRERLSHAHPERVDLLLSLCISQVNVLMFYQQQQGTEAYQSLRPRFRQNVAQLAQRLPKHPQTQQLIDLERRLP